MFNAFHHFSPSAALKVLRDAVRAREPIGVFEIPDRRWSTVISLLLLTPIMVAATTPFIRPFQLARQPARRHLECVGGVGGLACSRKGVTVSRD
jgi:hypothetical protein